MLDCSKLGESMEMWTYLGFEPWEYRGTADAGAVFMKGVARKITLVKGGVIGVIAKYYVWDYIVWFHQNFADPAQYIFQAWKPLPDVMTQRFLLVGTQTPRRKVKSFWLGFKGFLEIYSYIPGGNYHPKVKDLIPPVDMAWGIGKPEKKQ
ncbi:MAG: hypothetical protein LBS00_02600 [Synergistaceae bacterium]|jgi:hypothetical protein|nr:hypothetical protein [Synergistaceae bacterium]